MERILTIIIFFFCGASLHSQDFAKDTILLDSITIKAIKPKQKDLSLTPMQSKTRAELDRLPGSSAAEAVKTFSGLILKDYGGIGGLKTVMVRSLGVNHTGVFVDGVQFSDAASGQIDLGKISTEDAADISLYIGHDSKLSQPARFYASANTISINTLEPDFTSSTYRYKVGIKTGSFGLIQPNASIYKKMNDKSYGYISISSLHAEGKYPYLLEYGSVNDTNVYRENSDITSLNLNAKYCYNFVDSSKLSIKLYHYNSERGLPGAVVYYNPYSLQRLWNNDYFANIRYENNPNKRTQFLTNIKASESKLRYLDPEFLNTQGKLDNRYTQTEYYASQVISRKITDSLGISFAGDFFVNTLSANFHNYASPTRYTLLPAFALHYTLRNLETNASLLGSLVNENTKIAKPSSPLKKLSPAVSLGYKLSKVGNIKIRLLYKDIFRMPSFNDLYYTIVGNNSLQPEKAKQYNLGITGYTTIGIFDYISFKSDVFYNKVSDKIVAVPTKNLFVWSMRNVGSVDIRGIELQAYLQSRTLLDGFHYSLACNYTYQEAIDISFPGSATYQQQIPYIPYETFSAMSSIVYQKISLNYNVLFNGFRYVLGENVYENMMPSFWASDISILYNLDVRRHVLRIKGEVSNIFNNQYEVIRSFPMPGRAYHVSLTLNY